MGGVWGGQRAPHLSCGEVIYWDETEVDSVWAPWQPRGGGGYRGGGKMTDLC